MGILDQYRKALEEEKKNSNMDFPTDSNLTEKDKEAYEAELNKLRNASFSNDEVQEAINNSRKNMKDFGEEHDGGNSESGMKTQQLVRLTDENLTENSLLRSEDISDIKVIRAYCPKCGKELVAKTPPMYNPFTMQKVCLHECCDTKYNLDKTYPHIAFYDNDGNEINSFAQ